MSSTSSHFLAGGGGSAGLLNGVGRIQHGDEDVTVSDRKRVQADVICSAIWVAREGLSSDAMSAMSPSPYTRTPPTNGLHDCTCVRYCALTASALPQALTSSGTFRQRHRSGPRRAGVARRRG